MSIARKRWRQTAPFVFTKNCLSCTFVVHCRKAKWKYSCVDVSKLRINTFLSYMNASIHEYRMRKLVSNSILGGQFSSVVHREIHLKTILACKCPMTCVCVAVDIAGSKWVNQIQYKRKNEEEIWICTSYHHLLIDDKYDINFDRQLLWNWIGSIFNYGAETFFSFSPPYHRRLRNSLFCFPMWQVHTEHITFDVRRWGTQFNVGMWYASGKTNLCYAENASQT